MKKNLFAVCLILLSVSYGCDWVNYRNVKENISPVVPVNPVDDTTQVDSLATFLPVRDFAQKVFLEDFTGHTCGNCPFAAAEAKKLEKDYTGRLVVMAIHCGFFARPNLSPTATKFTADFRTPVGDAIDAKAGASAAGLPKGTIQRKGFSSSKMSLLGHTEWNARIAQLLGQPSNGAGVALNPKYNAANRLVRLYSTISFQKAYSGRLKVAAYLVEDSIVSWQKFYPTPGVTEDIPDYLHNHTLRGALSPVSGKDDLSPDASIAANSTFNVEWTAVLPNVVNAKNCHIIFIVTRSDNDEVIQVEEVKLTK